mmetsp:Transcript_19994/g.46531  ORF Transcript_19994/g.46531 Transcript_19994/m.46531 type:complete len:857 (-) Transcript_19994:258-2828(-)
MQISQVTPDAGWQARHVRLGRLHQVDAVASRHPPLHARVPSATSSSTGTSSDSSYLSGGARVAVSGFATLASSAALRRDRSVRKAAPQEVESRKRQAKERIGAPSDRSHEGHHLGDPAVDAKVEDIQRLLQGDLEAGSSSHSDEGKGSLGHLASQAFTSIKNASEAVGVAATHAVLGPKKEKEGADRKSQTDDPDSEGGWLRGVMEALKGSSSSSTDKGQSSGSGFWEGIATASGTMASSIKKATMSFFDSDASSGRKGPFWSRKGDKGSKDASSDDDSVGEWVKEAAEAAQEVAEAAEKAQQEVAEKAQEAALKAQEAAMEALESLPGIPGTQDEAETKAEDTVPKAPTKKVDLPPLPTAPGMERANFTVGTKVPLQKGLAKTGGTEGVDRLMALPGGRILQIMCSAGWEVVPQNVEKGLYDIYLPPVKYEVPLGATVTIPPPHFETLVTDMHRASPRGHCERLAGDLILQNGKDILTVELGFPFNKVIAVSAAGWTRAFIGWSDDAVLVECEVEIGMTVPKVPGLTQIMEFFVKSYATQSTREIAASLALGADTSSLLDEVEAEEAAMAAEMRASGSDEVSEGPSSGAAPELSDSAAAKDLDFELDEVEWSVTEVKPSDKQESSDLAEGKSASDAAELQVGFAARSPRTAPDVPGLAQANLLVDVNDVRKSVKAATAGEAGLKRLMSESSLSILDCMTEGGWKVEQVDEAKGFFNLCLPAVTYTVGTAEVSTPAPEFQTIVHRDRPGGLSTDMVLMNGQDMLTIELGFPIYKTFKVSAAGWARAHIGIEEDDLVIETEVHVGLEVPEFFGLTQIMEYFVRTYTEESVLDIAKRLAAGAGKYGSTLQQAEAEEAN